MRTNSQEDKTDPDCWKEWNPALCEGCDRYRVCEEKFRNAVEEMGARLIF